MSSDASDLVNSILSEEERYLSPPPNTNGDSLSPENSSLLPAGDSSSHGQISGVAGDSSCPLPAGGFASHDTSGPDNLVHMPEADDSSSLHDPELTCSFCYGVYDNVVALRRHQNSIHHNLTNYACLYCDYTTPLKPNFMAHLLSHQARYQVQTRYKCEMCDFQADVEDRVKGHIQVMHLGVKLSLTHCQICARDLNTNDNMIRHMEKVHNTKWEKPPEEELKRIETARIEAAQARLKEVKPHKCDYCHFRSETSTTLKKHLKSLHPHMAKLLKGKGGGEEA